VKTYFSSETQKLAKKAKCDENLFRKKEQEIPIGFSTFLPTTGLPGEK
jgi:hypothetical protein